MAAPQHTRSSSTSSEIMITETVSSVQRYLCGNIFRSQRQLTRFVLCLTVLLLVTYFSYPFSSPEKTIPDSKLKASLSVRNVVEDEKRVSEYRATFFEEMGKRFAGKEQAMNPNSFHSSNDLSSEEQVPDSQSELLSVIAQKVKEAALAVAKCHEVPGMSIVLVKGGNSVKIPLGLADVSSGRPVTTETRFLLNSISKTFLAQLLAVLITESTNR